MRCLTLANRLRNFGCEVEFVCRNLYGDLFDLIVSSGFELNKLPSSLSESLHSVVTAEYAEWLEVSLETEIDQMRSLLSKKPNYDWLVVDHYALDQAWESQMRQFADRILVIDDIANRSHQADLLLDQNLYHNMESRYDGLADSSTGLLLGPQYALLRDEFVEYDRQKIVRDGTVQRILIFFGGVDATNETGKTLTALTNFDNLTLDIVLGQSNQRGEEIKKLAAGMAGWKVHHTTDRMADLMAQADLALGAGGTTTWERCWLGLPSVVWTLADNQIETTKAVAERGGCIYLGDYNQVTEQMIVDTVRSLMNDQNRMRSLSKSARAIMGSTHEAGVDRLLKLMKEGAHVIT
jgi:UDP-2,4-diacetamido-2,4,6-trideoxy-beta-L-altropyranose hydrolase